MDVTVTELKCPTKGANKVYDSGVFVIKLTRKGTPWPARTAMKIKRRDSLEILLPKRFVTVMMKGIIKKIGYRNVLIAAPKNIALVFGFDFSRSIKEKIRKNKDTIREFAIKST